MSVSSKIHILSERIYNTYGKITERNNKLNYKSQSWSYMSTRLSQLLDNLMEKTWIAAIIVVPVFFNIYSSRIFEPDKLTLLRTLAILLLILWIIKLADSYKHGQNNISIKWLKEKFSSPVILPVLFTIIVYLISTIFSVTPATSLLGSYQRLQGTYTTFSYIILFFMILANVRYQPQIDRIVTAIILSSLPVSLYGVLQRYQIDPIPWGGDVSIRIASNMGNSIFVAAYIIMVFPITAGRIFQSFRAILNETGFILSDFTKATAYVFIASLQVIALYFTGSRGPTLGWFTGCFFIILMLSLLWRKRNILFFLLSITILMAGVLLVLNIENGPLENLRNTPAIGRFGQLLDSESNNAKVRTYIWQGAKKLVYPHPPLNYPDGRIDIFNFLRPLIGYGPESMYVAYNPFYPPELTQVEKRNASPDRSHNETWDSLVITGLAGFFTYIFLFGSVIYYGLKWLGMINGIRQRNIFIGLFLGFGAVLGVLVVIWRGVPYLGVGIPFGMVIGIVFYISFIAIYGDYQNPTTQDEQNRAVLLTILMAAILSHFVEINFGIAIAATRTNFWVYTALLIVVGYQLQKPNTIEKADDTNEHSSNGADQHFVEKKRQQISRRKKTGSYAGKQKGIQLPMWTMQPSINSLILGILLVTLGYEFISVSQGGSSALEVIWNSFIRIKNVYSGISYGVLAMVLTTWIIGAVLLVPEEIRLSQKLFWLRDFIIILVGSFVVAFIFWIWHAGSLVDLTVNQASTLSDVINQVGKYENLLVKYYIYLIGLIFIGGIIFTIAGRQKSKKSSWQGVALSCIGLVIFPYISMTTNIKVIQADIAFKLAEPFNKESLWPVAIDIYNHAINLAPSEDYYYLFLGRAYLEHAKSMDNSEDRNQLIERAENDLKNAQRINPLNTDHTANLARLYSLWSALSDDTELRQIKAEMSSDYFAKAVQLSPNNARLWNEWGLLYLNNFGDYQRAYECLLRSLELDPYYDWTYALLGEYYARSSGQISEIEEKNQAIENAIIHYKEAKTLAGENSVKANYALAIAQLGININQYSLAIEYLKEAISLNPSNPDLWKFEQTLSQLYLQGGDKQNALIHAYKALEVVPEDNKDRIQEYIQQILTMP